MDQPGKIQGLQGSPDLFGVGAALLAVQVPSAGKEGEGLHPQGQGLGGHRALRVEIHLAAHEQGLDQAPEEPPGGFVGRGGQMVDPDTFTLGHGAGPGGQMLLPHTLFPSKQNDALHGDGGAEAQHQGFEIWQLLAAAAEGPGDGAGEIPGVGPGQVFGEGRSRCRARQEFRKLLQGPGPGAEHSGDLSQAGAQGDHFRVQTAGVRILGQPLPQVVQQGLALVLAPSSPQAGQGRALQGLEEPGLFSVEPEVGDHRIQRLRIQEPGEEGIPHLFEIPVRGQR